MAAINHGTIVYIGLGGEGPLIVGTDGPPVGVGGLYRRTDGEIMGETLRCKDMWMKAVA